MIILDCSRALVDPEEPVSDIPPKPEHIEALYLRLKDWYEGRPPGLIPANYPTPENLLTAMQYHVSIVRLFQPFVDGNCSLRRIATYRDRAVSLTNLAIKELRQLLFLQDMRLGWANAIPLVLHPIVVTSFGSLEEIVLKDEKKFEQSPNEPYQGLLTCLRALSIVGSYVFYAQPLFRLLTQTCQTLHIALPTEIIARLNDYQSEEWTKNAASVVSSQYIADIRKTATDVENARMDAIISRWDSLSIGEGSQPSAPEVGTINN
jgi:hypothetical protein